MTLEEHNRGHAARAGIFLRQRYGGYGSPVRNVMRSALKRLKRRRGELLVQAKERSPERINGRFSAFR